MFESDIFYIYVYDDSWEYISRSYPVVIIKNDNGEIFGSVLTAVNPKSNAKYSRSYRSSSNYYYKTEHDT